MLIGKTMNPMGSNQMSCRRKRERLAGWLTQAVVWGGWIAASQIAGNTALANEAATVKLSPIRLVSGTIQGNPFVERSEARDAVASTSAGNGETNSVHLIQTEGEVFPGGEKVLYPIRRTSDQTLSEIKLKSIGTAVGLLPIGAPATQHTPLVVEPTPASQPKINPFAQPDYDRAESNGVVELTPAQVSTGVKENRSVPVQPNAVQPNAVQPNAVQPNAVQPNAVQPNAVQPDVQWQQPRVSNQPSLVNERDVVAEVPVVRAPSVQAPVIPHSAAVELADVAPIEDQIIAISDESDPIEFSLNDATDSVKAEDDSVSLSFSDSDESADGRVAGGSVSLPEPMKIAVPTKIAPSVEVSAAESTLPRLPKPVQIERPSEMMVQQQRQLPVKIDSPTQLERTDSERMQNAPLRHRAAVAVEAPPMVAVAKRTKLTSSGARVSAARIVPAALASHRGGFHGSAAAIDVERSLPIQDTIQCDADDVTSLAVEGIVEAVQVEDDSIARVISSTSRHLRLIGIRPGKTRVLVQQKVAGNERSVRKIYELHIVSPSNVRVGESLQEQSLMELIKEKHSTASVQITRQGDRIIVQGECDDSRDAKEIVRLIRKTYLVPVEDQLILR